VQIGLVGIGDVAADPRRGRAPTDTAAERPAARLRLRAAAGTAQQAAAAREVAERATWADLAAVGGLATVLVEGA
jgi:hypothetical protein